MLICRDGPIGEEDLHQRTSLDRGELEACLRKLVESGRAERAEDGRYDAAALVIPLGSSAGSEAALFDHYARLARRGGLTVSPIDSNKWNVTESGATSNSSRPFFLLSAMV